MSYKNQKPWQQINHYWTCSLKGEVCGDDIIVSGEYGLKPPNCQAMHCFYYERYMAQSKQKEVK